MSFFFAAVLFLLGTTAQAEEKSNQPYIDRLKSGMEIPIPTPESTESYTESLRKKLPPKEDQTFDSEAYIKKLKRDLPERRPKDPDEPKGSYTEEQKKKLAPKTAEEESAIAKFNSGESELHARKQGDIHHAFGLRVGASVSRDINATPGASLRSFNSVYGASWAPDVTFFWEWQPYHSEWFGNIGLLLSGGGSFYKGTGTFEFKLKNMQDGGSDFAQESRTKFGFFSIPVTVALDYRFNLLRILRPYVAAGPTLIGYMETRNDSKSGNRGYSTGISFQIGTALLLDWFSSGSSWNLYAEHGVKHYYLTVEYLKLTSLAGDIQFANSGIFAGLTFEY